MGIGRLHTSANPRFLTARARRVRLLERGREFPKSRADVRRPLARELGLEASR